MDFTPSFLGKKVWISGVTGFKGSWLAEWLTIIGAEVCGFSLMPPTSPSLFEQSGQSLRLRWDNADLRNADAVKASILTAKPDFVFHLAAQPLVRLSYKEPAETWQTNVLGTIHVLEALRNLEHACTAIFITTDKCYENREWLNGYREDDQLGGFDPYSSSKAACEIAIASWRRSFFKNHPVKIASARAGNVIGGGDWALDRIVPDCIRSLKSLQPIPVRNKTSTRPWQHVLEPLSGYLSLAAHVTCGALNDLQKSESPSAMAFNFGPDIQSNRTVADLVAEILRHWPGEWIDESSTIENAANDHFRLNVTSNRETQSLHEAGKLNLSTDKAFHLLGWRPRWGFAETIEKTVAWYRRAQTCNSHHEVYRLIELQIKEYQQG